MTSIVLPWPAKPLSPNYRSGSHWPKTRAVKAARKLACGEAMAAGWHRLTLGDGPINLRVTFHPPDARARDRDNMIASTKAMHDGLSDALGVDDARFHPEYRFAEPKKPGCVVVEVLRPPLGVCA